MDYQLASSGGGRASGGRASSAPSSASALSSEENDSNESEEENFARQPFPSKIYRAAPRAVAEQDEDDEDEEDDDFDDEESRDSDSADAPPPAPAPPVANRKVKPRLTALPRVKKREAYSQGGRDGDADGDADGDGDSDDQVGYVHVGSLTTDHNEASSASESHASADEDLPPQDSRSQANAKEEGQATSRSRGRSRLWTAQQECEPSADPAEVECVVTDTSDDEDVEVSGWGPDEVRRRRRLVKREPRDVDADADDGAQDDRERPKEGSVQCELCDTIFGPQECPKELLKHMQSVHKFAVRGLDRDAGGTEASERMSSPVGVMAGTEADAQDADAQLGPRKAYNCDKERGGCGAVFFSRQGLSSHHARSQSAGGTCWLVATFAEEQGGPGPVHTCALCSLGCVSRRMMLRHLEAKHRCVRGPDEPAMAALALSCRVCGARFWSVDKRSAHEVEEHPDEAAYLTLKCYLCKASHSSKVCLKKHVEREHPKEEQFEAGVAFRCRICCTTFPNISLIQEHFRQRHPSVLVFRCHRCNLILKTKKTFQVHLKSTQCGAVRRECTLCNKVMWSKRAVSIHYRMKHSSSSRIGFMCRICKQRFDTKAERKEHYNNDHQGDSPFHCPICNKGFASKSGMYGHRQTHVKTGLSKCEFCGKEFTRRDSYNEHLLIHTGPRHKCPHCSKEFVQRSNLVRHIRIHTGEKPYKCSFCEKTFSDKGACNSHIRVHTREEACGCPYCGQVFSKKQKLKYHIRKHTGEGLVGCEFCGKMFTNGHSLKEHRAIHDRRTQILCSHCGKAFTTAKYLQRHIAMVHEALYVYNCPICDRGFGQQGRLRSHLMTHTGIKHLRCLLCTKAYSSRKSLRRHLVGMHGVPIEHPDYKQCFYAMTPEEAGLTLPDTQATLRSGSGSGSRGARGGGGGASAAGDADGDSDSGSMPLLQPKVEPESADSGSEKNSGSSSEDDDDSNGPPQLERQEPLNGASLSLSASLSFNVNVNVNGDALPTATDPSMLPVMRQVPFSGIRTKAARKQLPLNILVQDNNKLKGRAPSGSGPLKVKPAKRTRKPRAKEPKERASAEGLPPQGEGEGEGPDAGRSPLPLNSKAENGGRLTRQVSPRGSFYEGYDLDDGLSSSESDSGPEGRAASVRPRPPKKGKARGNAQDEDNWRPGKWKPKKKTSSPKKATASESAATDTAAAAAEPKSSPKLVPGATVETGTGTGPEPAKSNRRARYKLQNPKKRVLPPEDVSDRIAKSDRSMRERDPPESYPPPPPCQPHHGHLPQLPTSTSQGNVWIQGQNTDASFQYNFKNGLDEVKTETFDLSFRESPPPPQQVPVVEERMKEEDMDSDEGDSADVAAMVFDYCGRANAASKPEFNVSTGYVQESA